MGLQGSRNVDFGQFSQLQLCEPIFGSDKVVLAYRLLGLTMLSAQWATRGPEMMILAFLSKKWVLKAGIGQTGQNHHFWTPGCQ